MAFNIINAYLIPDEPTFRLQMQALKNKMENNADLKQAFKDDPRAVLGSHGISRPIQNEILKAETNMNIDMANETCGCSGCCVTCGCSGCCVTI